MPSIPTRCTWPPPSRRCTASSTSSKAGLWRAKAWASWLGCIAAALYLPFDLYALALHRHWLEAVVVAINLLVVWVLARDLMVRRR